MNDALVAFPDAQPYLGTNGLLMVPVRFVSEKLGLQVDWTMDGDSVRVMIKDGKHTVQMKTGESTAVVDGVKIEIAGQPAFSEGRVYVPLHFIADTFGVRIQWDNQNVIAILDADGRYHAPAWYAAVSTNATALPQQIIQTASSYMGVPYRWGGTTPGGFDCSGFVQFVFQKVDVELPRTSQEMYTSSGVSVSDPQPGDLVFFARNGQTSHVGIYIGGNQFISATNDGVTIASLSSSYWSSQYIGAKRIM